MSRTYRRKPIVKGNLGGRRFAKRQANKKVRNYKGVIPEGRFYKKMYCSYKIYDYKTYVPYSEYRKRFEDKYYRELYGWDSEEDCYQDWAKIFLYK